MGEILPDEQLDDLGRGRRILQKKKGFKYGTDSVLLAKLALMSPKRGVAVDLGTGTGILPILISADPKFTKIYGIELAPEYADMARRSVAMNGLSDRIEIIQGNLKQKAVFPTGLKADAVLANPPYKRAGTGLSNETEAETAARQETGCNLEDVISAAAGLLKFRGTFYMVISPDRLADFPELMRKYSLEPKYMRLVYPKLSKKPAMVLVTAVKGGGRNLTVDRPLILLNEDGSETEELRRIYEY